MLRRLTIRDFVIVDRLELEFESGFGALTGETGAGKSILVDALALAMGDRADAGVVRNGCKQAEVSAEFELAGTSPALDWLTANDLAADDACLMRRVIEAGGRSRGYINGSPATAAQLRELGDLVADIHGQHAHHALLRSDAQRALIDAHGGQSALAREVAAEANCHLLVPLFLVRSHVSQRDGSPRLRGLHLGCRALLFSAAGCGREALPRDMCPGPFRAPRPPGLQPAPSPRADLLEVVLAGSFVRPPSLLGLDQPLEAVADGAGGAVDPLRDPARRERQLGFVLAHVAQHQAVELAGAQALDRAVAGRPIRAGGLGCLGGFRAPFACGRSLAFLGGRLLLGFRRFGRVLLR